MPHKTAIFIEIPTTTYRIINRKRVFLQITLTSMVLGWFLKV